MLQSMMRNVFCAGSLIFLSSIQGEARAETKPSIMNVHEGVYEGAGEWKTTGGAKGVYRASVETKHLDESSCEIKGSVTFLNESQEEQTESWTSIVKRTDDGMMSIFDTEQNQIGDGYCFLKDEMVLCHMDVTIMKGGFPVVIEETLHLSEAGIGRIGSKTMSGVKVMFFDRLRKTSK